MSSLAQMYAEMLELATLVESTLADDLGSCRPTARGSGVRRRRTTPSRSPSIFELGFLKSRCDGVPQTPWEEPLRTSVYSALFDRVAPHFGCTLRHC
jgi:hypothetical protein